MRTSSPSRTRRSCAPVSTAQRPRRFRPLLELLEDRTLLTAYVVTTTADVGSGSLRAAITTVNANIGYDSIQFGICWKDPGHVYYKAGGNGLANDVVAQVPKVALDGVTPITSDAQLADPTLVGAGNVVDPAWPHSWWRIQPASELPGLARSAVVNGYSQPGSQTNTLAGVSALGSTDVVLNPAHAANYGDNAIPRIELDGEFAGAGASGLSVTNSVVSGFAINRFDFQGIGSSGGSTITGNFIGTDISGTVGLGNHHFGVMLNGNDTLGGTKPEARNVIAATSYPSDPHYSYQGDGVYNNHDGNVIEGNFIGTDATGTRPLGNAEAGIVSAASQTLINENLISGNGGSGLTDTLLGGPGDVITGNFIGTDVTGTRLADPGPDRQLGTGDDNALGSVIGIYLRDGGYQVQGNLLSGNGSGIEILTSGTPANELIQNNYIGTDVSGMAILGNTTGVFEAVGDDNSILDNLIAGNGADVSCLSGNRIEGNLVGTDRYGTANIQPGWAVTQHDPRAQPASYVSILNRGGIGIGGSNNQVVGNVIANGGIGLATGNGGTQNGNTISQNSIFDVGFGIDLGGFQSGGPIQFGTGNNSQAAPALYSAATTANASTITGTLRSVPATSFRLEFFSTPWADGNRVRLGYGPGETYLGSVVVTTDANGQKPFIASGLAPYDATQRFMISATATNLTTGDTSPFAESLITNESDQAGPNVFRVTNADDHGFGSLRQAILDANYMDQRNSLDQSNGSGVNHIVFAIPASVPHMYWKDDHRLGHVGGDPTGDATYDASLLGTTTLDDSNLTPAQIEAALPNIEPDYPHTWWSIQLQTALPSLNNAIVVDGTTQPGAVPNTLAQGDNAVLRIELDGSRVDADSPSQDGRWPSLLYLNNTWGCTVRGLAINRFLADYPVAASPSESGTNPPFAIFCGSQDVVAGNFIGTDISGLLAMNHQWGGILLWVGAPTRVGSSGTGPSAYGDRNLLTGQLFAISSIDTGTLIAGNLIGTDRNGNRIGNSTYGNLWCGIGLIHDGNDTSGIIGGVGELPNTIAYNGGPGVWNFGYTRGSPDPTWYPNGGGDNEILGNSIHDNAGRGINLGGYFDSTGFDFTGPVVGTPSATPPGPLPPDGIFRFPFSRLPVIDSITSDATGTTITGTVDTTTPDFPSGLAGDAGRVEFFANSHPGDANGIDPNLYGEGETYLGGVDVVADASGQVSFTASGLAAVPAGQPYLSATVTWLPTADHGYDAGTSEFSADLALPSARLSGPTALSGSTATFTLTTADSLPADAQARLSYDYTIAWGDGTFCHGSTPASNGPGVPLSHPFPGAGIYPIQVTTQNAAGSISTYTTLFVNSLASGDSITVSGGSTPGSVIVATSDEGSYSASSALDRVLVAGQGGADLFTVQLGMTLTTPLTIAGSGSAGGDTLSVIGPSGDSPTQVSKTSGLINWISPVAETVQYSGVQHTVITANSSTSNYILDPGGNTTINGGPGANTIIVSATSGSGVVVNGGPSTNQYLVNLGSLAAPVTIQNSSGTASDSLVINGAAGNNAITASGNQVTAAAQAPITVNTSLANLTVTGGSGSNQIAVVNPTVPVQNLTVSATGTSNTVKLVNVGASVAALAVAAPTAGTTQVQVQGALPAVVQAQNVPPLVNPGNNIQATERLTRTTTGSFTPSDGLSCTATVNYGDGTGTHALALAPDDTFTLRHAYAQDGTYTITVSVTDSQGRTGTGSLTARVGPDVGLLLLDPTGKGALSLSGNSSLVVEGSAAAIVNSTNAGAVSLSGTSSARADEFDVTGTPGVQTTGGSRLTGQVQAALAALADPLSGLPAPAVPATTYAAVKASGQVQLTLQPGSYVGGISVSGQAAVTLQPGLYYMQGGGLSVSGQASLTGSGVMIYNAPKGNGDAISLTGQGSVVLSPPTDPTYQGITLFQARTSTVPVTLSGSGHLAIGGTLYAAGAVVNVTGNGGLNAQGNPLDSIGSRVIAYDLKVSGNGAVAIGNVIPIQQGQTATASFWNGAQGRQLLTSLNGGAASTALATWLASSFANLFGSGAGAGSLAGKTNAQVAAYLQSLYAQGSQALALQVLTTALNGYATTSSLGGTAAVGYGFLVSFDGVGAGGVSVGASGAAFGVADNNVLTVTQLLQAVNKQAKNGLFYNGDPTLGAEALNLFTAINGAGGVG